MTAHPLERAPGGAIELLAQHLQAAFLGRAQGAYQGQQGRLAGPGRTGDDDDFATIDIRVDVEEDLLAQRALTIVVVEAAHANRRIAHQNTSAGSSFHT